MEHDEPSRTQPLSQGDDTSLYEQGLQYRYFNPTQPLRLPVPPKEERLRYLSEQRERHQQQNGTKQKGWFTRLFTRTVSAERGSQQVSLVSAALIISVALIASRVLGLVETSLFTVVFEPGGASGAVTDAYQQAFLVPDLIYNVISGGALMSAFIPVFNMYMLGERDEKTAWRIASIALNLSVLLMVVLALLVIVFARQIVTLYNVGPDPRQVKQYAIYLAHLNLIATLTRIMLLQAVFMGASVVVMSVLNARQHFLLPAIAPVLYNVGLIVGLIPGLVLVLTHQRNDVVAVYAATWGVVIGAFCFFAVQLFGLRRVGMRYSFSLNWRSAGIRRIAKQMIPRIANAAMVNVSTAIDRLFIEVLIVIFGSALLQGLIAQYVFAFGIVLVPLSGVMAVCTAAFPRMTEYVAAGRIDRFRALVIETLRSILFLAIPCSIGLMLLSYPVIQVLYEHGSLNQNEAQSMAIPLFCFALCLPGLAIIEILTRSFYALHSSVTPVIISIGQFIVKIALSVLLLNFTLRLIQAGIGAYMHIPLPPVLLNGALGMGGLAIATSIAVLLEAVVLLWLLRPQVGGLQLRPLTSFTLRVLIASLIMGAGLLVVRLLLDNLLVTTGSDGRTSLGIVGILLALVKLAIIGGVGSFIYLRVSRIVKTLESREISSVYRLLSRLHLS